MSNSHLDDESKQTITQQAEEIVELKAAYNLLHKAAKEYVTDSYRPEPKYDAARFDMLTEAVEQSAEQSLADHDLIKRNEVIDSCVIACQVEALSDYAGKPEMEVINYCIEAIRNLKTTQD